MKDNLKKENNLLKYKLNNITVLNEEDIRIVNNNKQLGLLDIELQQFNEDSWLVYDINGKSTLKEYLAKVLTTDKIYYILENLNSIFFENNRLINLNKVILEDNSIFVNEVNGEPRLYYIYIPINEDIEVTIDKNNIDSIIFEVLINLKEDKLRNKCIDSYKNQTLRDVLIILKQYDREKNNILPVAEVEESTKSIAEEIVNNETNNKKIKKKLSIRKLFKNLFKKKKRENINYEISADTTLLEESYETMILITNGRLLIYNDNNKYVEEELNLNSMVIGRSENCDIVINSKIISKNHATIFMEKDEYYIKDMNSKNKTYVNGKVIKSNNKMKLSDQDEIVFGNIKCKFTR